MKSLALFLITLCSISAWARGGAMRPGIREEAVVIRGALLRAGGPGGMVSLSRQTLNGLCQEGVHTVYYLYPHTNFRTGGAYNCGGNTLDYKGAGFLSEADVRPIFDDIYKAIMDGGGPVLVHCWNGHHASGEVAAVALMQFCGYSGEQAAQYWLSTAGNTEGVYTGSLMNRIRRFQIFPDLIPPAAVQKQVCPM